MPSTWFISVRLNQLINSECFWSVTESNPITEPSPIAFKEQVFWVFGTTFYFFFPSGKWQDHFSEAETDVLVCEI